MEAPLELVERPGLRVLARPGLHDAVLAATDPEAARGAARGRVRFVEVAGARAAVRHFFRGGLVGRVLRDVFLDGERVLREARLYETARARGVPTLEPIGAVARRAGPRWGPFEGWRMDLVTVAVENARDLGETFASGLVSYAEIDAAAVAVKALHDAGVEHVDLNLKNILLAGEAGAAPRALVIDLDRAIDRGASLHDRPREKNLFRLWRSAWKIAGQAGKQPPARLALRFLLTYTGREGRERARAMLRRERTERVARAARSLLWKKTPRPPETRP